MIAAQSWEAVHFKCGTYSFRTITTAIHTVGGRDNVLKTVEFLWHKEQ